MPSNVPQQRFQDLEFPRVKKSSMAIGGSHIQQDLYVKRIDRTDR